MPQILLALQGEASVNAIAIQSQVALRLDAPGVDVAAGSGVACQGRHLALSGPMQPSVSSGVGINPGAVSMGLELPQASSSVGYAVMASAKSLAMSAKAALVSADVAVSASALALSMVTRQATTSADVAVAQQSTPSISMDIHGGLAHYVRNEVAAQESALRLSMEINQTEVERELLSTYFAESEIEVASVFDVAMTVSVLIISRIDNEVFTGKSPIDLADSGESEITTSILLTSEVE